MKNKAELFLALAEGKKIQRAANAIGGRPQAMLDEEVLMHVIDNRPLSELSVQPDYLDVSSFRIPRPMTEAPEEGVTYYTFAACAEGWVDLKWANDGVDMACLEGGRCWATEGEICKVVRILRHQFTSRHLLQASPGPED